MLPPSGSGVTESLALDQAPLTRMTPVGTFVLVCALLETLPPLLETFCGPAPSLQGGIDTDKARTTEQRQNPVCIFLLESDQLLSPVTERGSVVHRFLT